jgi:hypothetical protein
LLTARALRRGVHRSTTELEAAISDCIAVTNADPKPFRTISSPPSNASVSELPLNQLCLELQNQDTSIEQHGRHRLRAVGAYLSSESPKQTQKPRLLRQSGWRSVKIRLLGEYYFFLLNHYSTDEVVVGLA